MSKKIHRNSLQPGYTLLLYRIKEILGQGGFGITYLAEDTNLDSEVAVRTGDFSILKRSLNGVYQHCSKQHPKRYLGEYDFRYNYREKLGYDNITGTNLALRGIEGKRLMYRDSPPAK